jgi:histidinol-phosphate aminotransferase
MTTGPSPRSEILNIHPYVAGESSIAGANRSIKLSSNEGAFGVPPGAQAAIQAAMTESFRYPDGGCEGAAGGAG